MSSPQPALRRRRLVHAAAAAAAVPAVAAVACSGAGTPPASAIGPAQIAMVHWGQGFAAELRQRQVDAFMAAYPQIKVEHQPTPGGAAYFDKLQARYAAGSAPDMFFFEPKDLLGYVARRLLLDLEPLARRDKASMPDFYDEALNQWRVRGRLYALPWMGLRGIFYNKELFQRAGVGEPPAGWRDAAWTWDGFLEAARRLTRPDGPNGAQYGWNTGFGLRAWVAWVYNNGGELFSKDYRQTRLAEPPAVEAIQFLADLIHKHRVMAPPGTQGVGFIPGNVAMQESVPAGNRNTRDQAKFAWDAAPMPRGKGGPAATGGGVGWMIARPTRAPDAAWELNKWINGHDMQRLVVEEGLGMPSIKSLATDPLWTSPKAPPLRQKLFTDGLPYLRLDPLVVNFDEIEKVLGEELTPVWQGQAIAQAATANIKRRVDPLLAEGQRQVEALEKEAGK
jgi:multiple sugar transport system substrate-binding protein